MPPQEYRKCHHCTSLVLSYHGAVLRLVPGDFKISVAGQKFKLPFHEYNGKLPQTACATRPALETLLRRLVIGRKQYPGIEQIPGIVVGFDKVPDEPSRLNKVLVRQSNGEMVAILATLILGEPVLLPLLTRINVAILRLHWASEC